MILFVQVAGSIATVTAVLLAVFAASRALIGFFPMDAPHASKTATGRLHNLLATAAFASVTAAAFTAAGALQDLGAGDVSGWSTVCGILMAVGTLGVLLASRIPRLHGLFGAAERLIYVGFLLLFVLLGVIALR